MRVESHTPACSSPSEHQSDKELVRAARRGETAAMSFVIERHDSELRHLAYHLLRDPWAVDDVLQEVYLKVFVGLKGFRGESSLRTWLHRVAFTTCMTWLRQARAVGKSGSLDAGVPVSSEDDPADAIIARNQLEELLHSLPAEQRAAVLLVDAFGFSVKDASEILASPMSTTSSRVQTARTRLRAAVVAESRRGE